MEEPVIVVHGGAAAYALVERDNINKSDIEDGVIDAAKAGYDILSSGGTAIDAVQAAVLKMEDNPIFNCGYGSFLTSEHTVEMDASIMDGSTLSTGAVACITNVSNPILVARAVMDKTPHTTFCGQAAVELAKSFGFEIIPTEKLVTAKAVNRMKGMKDTSASPSAEQRLLSHTGEHDTVGAVAFDRQGNVSYATSTGGITGKLCGRVGDSPIVGSGGYADNRAGAVSTTGDGEAFVKLCTAKHVSLLMEQGDSPQSAVEKCIDCLEQRLGARGGCVAVNNKGDVGVYFNSKGMAWAVLSNNTIRYGLYKHEDNTRQYSPR